jgi:hypothetical protein
MFALTRISSDMPSRGEESPDALSAGVADLPTADD